MIHTQSPLWLPLFPLTFRKFLISVSMVIIIYYLFLIWGFPGGSVVKKPPVNAGCGFDIWVGKSPWRKTWQPTPVFLPGTEKNTSVLWTEKSSRLESQFSSVRFIHSVMSNFLDPMNCSTPGLPVHHQLPESTQTHVHWVYGVTKESDMT